MGRWLSFLDRVGLVELSPQERVREEARRAAAAARAPEPAEDLIAQTEALGEALPDEAPPSAPAAPVGPALTDAQIYAGRDLADIYGDAGVPVSPFPADQLLRVLDGLQAMEEPVRRAAIFAMDAADDAWTLGDPLLDAQRKIEVLDGELVRLDGARDAAESEGASGLAAQDEYQEQATATIREQIAELEEMLENVLRTVADDRSQIRLELEQKRAAIVREADRYQEEIRRLRTLAYVFPQPDN
jgi:hypothetical protein